MARTKFITLISLLCFVATAMADNEFIENDIKYMLDDQAKTAKVISGGNCKGEVVIPDKLVVDGVGYKVTSIGDNAFTFAFFMTSIEIPNSATSIGDGAFSSSGLTTIKIPSSVTQIGEMLFSNCVSLHSIIVDENNKVYDSRNNCNAIIETKTNCLITGCSNTVIPPTVTTIGEKAFNMCYGLETITIPSSVRTIKKSAFAMCNQLTTIKIPSSVKTIGSGAFEHCI